jgi:NTP pyrophosphatase (non-canonical NTP hydrolase)
MTPFPDFGISYLTPMVKVMSEEFKEKFEDVSKNTQQIEMKVTNEEEMEDVIFLVSLQAKKLRNALV